jgi:hypothetical protein
LSSCPTRRRWAGRCCHVPSGVLYSMIDGNSIYGLALCSLGSCWELKRICSNIYISVFSTFSVYITYLYDVSVLHMHIFWCFKMFRWQLMSLYPTLNCKANKPILAGNSPIL